MPKIDWKSIHGLEPKPYECPYCNNQIASEKGYYAGRQQRIYICPLCSEPTYFGIALQVPGTPYGDKINDLPSGVQSLYEEARQSMSVSAFTAAVMLCRKVLMNVAVAEGAEVGKSFVYYVDYLATKGYVPPKGRGWVDHIRTIGNEANHEINQTSREDASEIVLFTGMLLRFIYELPARRPLTIDT